MERKPKNVMVIFFLVYILLMASLIFFAVNHNNTKNFDAAHLKEKPQNEVASTFSKELKTHEEKIKQKQKLQEHRWKPTKTFVITAISISSVLDIVIILLWARHENKKRQGEVPSTRKKLTNQKWFWNVVALGIVQPKDNRIVINWKNVIVFLIAMYFLKNLLFKYLEKRNSFDQSMLLMPII